MTNNNNSDQADRRPLQLRAWKWLQSVASGLAGAGVSPNAISVVGILIALACGILLYLTGGQPATERLLWFTAALLMLLRVLANTLDGMVAVEHGKATRVGLLYNEAPDRIADVVILIGAGYAHGGDVTLGYLAACIALFVAYVRTLARTAGAPSDFGGPMNKRGRVLTLLFVTCYMGAAPAAWHFVWGPDDRWGVMALGLLLVCVGGIYTAAWRLRTAGRYLRENE
jgi:phosphatidylglycerophosphate synthase